MAKGAATWAHAGFALGYAEYGTFPVGRRASAACIALQEASEELDGEPPIAWIVEAGRTAGKQSSREKAHRKLYDFHSGELASVLTAILGRLDLDAVANAAVATAKEQADAGADPVDRRKSVQAIALASIAQHVSADDRQRLDAANAAGWAHATAYGTAEAQATPAKGGPPDPKKVVALAAVAYKALNAETAAEASATWTALELQTVAMGAAMAAGDGKALGEATRAVKDALVSTDRATLTYANQLHQAVTQAYVAQTIAANPEAEFDWVTADDPCDECEDAEMEGPYSADDLPDGPPLHPNCMCDLELASTSVLANA